MGGTFPVDPDPAHVPLPLPDESDPWEGQRVQPRSCRSSSGKHPREADTGIPHFPHPNGPFERHSPYASGRASRVARSRAPANDSASRRGLDSPVLPSGGAERS
eukprot:scaffold53_cov362-Prasinococcus_capsulatus_cf.AAC.8